MSSDEPLTRIAIESLRAIARNPGASRPGSPAGPEARLELLNAILLRDQAVAVRHVTHRRRIASGRTRL